MIRLVEGTIITIDQNSVTVLVNGIGYLIHTITARSNFMAGENARFHTYLAVRETSLDLYGFSTERELVCFELLLLVPKIGPKSALQVLSSADPDLIATAVVLGDADHLHKVSGIGKKTALNIVTALAGKIDATTAKVDTPHTPINAPLSESQKDAIDALVTLGYDQKDAQLLILKLDSSLEAKVLIQAVLTTKKPD